MVVMDAISRKRPLERVSSSSRALLPPEWLALTTKPMTAVRASRSLVLFMIAAAMGGARDNASPHGRSAFQAYNARLLASWYPRGDLEIDLNLGAANVYGSGTFALAGAAVQYAIIEKVQLLAEVFRDEPGRAKYQVGARYIVIPGRFETYASYGKPFGGSSGQWS